MRTSDELTEELSGRCFQDGIVDVHQRICSGITIMIDEHQGVEAGGAKTKPLKELRDVLVPSMWCLLQAI